MVPTVLGEAGVKWLDGYEKAIDLRQEGREMLGN